MKTLLIISASLFFNFNFFAQTEIGLKLDCGASTIIPLSPNLLELHGRETYSYKYKLSGNGGLYYKFNIGKHFYFGFETILIVLNGRTRQEGTYVNITTNPWTRHTDVYTRDFDFNYDYLGLPIYFGLNIKKLSINLGIQTSLLLVDKWKWNTKYQTDQDPIEYSLNSSGWNPTFAITEGVRFGLTYKLANRLTIEGKYYAGYDTFWMWGNDFKIKQITLGVNYNFHKKVEKGKE